MKAKNIIVTILVAILFAAGGFFLGNKLNIKTPDTPECPATEENSSEVTEENSSEATEENSSENAEESDESEENMWATKEKAKSEEIRAILSQELSNAQVSNKVSEESEKLYKKCDEMKNKILESIDKAYARDGSDVMKDYFSADDIKEAFIDYYEERLECIKEKVEWEQVSADFEYFMGTGGGLEIAVRENNAIYTFYEELCMINERY